MIKRNFKKLYGKIASLRDYEVEEAKKKGGCIFDYQGKTMTLTAEELDSKRFACHGKFIPSKIPTWKNPLTGLNGYSFVDYVFTQDGATSDKTQD